MGEKRMRFRRAAGSALLFVLCLTACGKGNAPEGNELPGEEAGETTPGSGGEEGEAGTPTPAPTLTPTAVPTQKAEHPQPPSPTATPEPESEPEEDKEKPENSAGDGAPTLVFSTVTPVPSNQVRALAGTMTREDFPIVDGSTATIPLSEAVYCLATGEDAEAAKSVINHTKTTNSYMRLYDGEVDLLIVYEPSQSIITRMQEEPLAIKPIGLDALVFMANAANPVESLTAQQLLDIYAGNVSDWSEVGGKEQELLAFQRPEGSGSQTLMQKLVMGDTAMAQGDNIYRYHTMADILEGMLNFTGDDNTLGYSVYYYASQMYHLPDLKFMGVNGVIPSTKTIYDGTYPYTNAFYAVIRPDEPEDSNAHKIFDWLTGQEGQQMVLDLGYVPVIMPEGAQIENGAAVAGGAQEIEISPKADLKEGQYYIFFQKQNDSWEFDYGKVTVYDHKWQKCASFYNVETRAQGVQDGRYLSLSQFRAAPDGGELELSRIYDLKERRFLDEEWLEGAWLEDPVRGYFGKYPTEEEKSERDGEDYHEWGKLYNAAGEVVLDYVPMYEGSMRLYMERNCYVSTEDEYIKGDDDRYVNYRLTRIYDPDLHLKQVISSHEEMLPPQNERQKGVNYLLISQGCILSEDGEMILNPAMFLERFGDGSDMKCEMAVGTNTSDGYWFEEDPSEIYEVYYKGKSYYVDRTLSFYWIEGEERGCLAVPDTKGLPEYFVARLSNDERDNRYFTRDGEPLLMQDGTAPDQVLTYGGSYALVHIGTDAIVAEEHLPDQNQVKTWHYPAPNQAIRSYVFRIYYLGSHGFAIRDDILAPDGLNEESQEIRFYQGEEETARYTAKDIMITEEYCRNHDRTEDLWLRLKHSGTGGEDSLQEYGLLRDGKLCFLVEQASLEYSGDGYALFTAGNYDVVYDADGNIVLRAINRMLEMD